MSPVPSVDTSSTQLRTLRRRIVSLGVVIFALVLVLGFVLLGNARSFNPASSLVTLRGGSANQVEEQIRALIEQNYPEPLADVDFEEGRIRGYVAALEDPYTEYLSAEDWAEFNEALNEQYVGIGIRFSNKVEGYLVEDVIPNSPAANAGLEVGDFIYKIEDTLASEIPFDDVAPRIKGPAGSQVNLVLLRGGKEIPVTLTRQAIEIEQLTWSVEGDTGIITISSFGEGLDAKMNQAVRELNAAGVDKVVLDLRSNGGGLLTGAIDIASYFLPADTVVLTEQTSTDTETYRSVAKDQNFSANIDVAVVVDRYSASASEIVAGALRDHLGATLVGEKTFGKGVVQRVYPLNNGARLKLTIAEWFTPAGTEIHEIGLLPDVPVAPEEDALALAKDALN